MDATAQSPSGGFKVRFGRHGVHAFDRVRGLNVLVDEVAVPPARWHAAPRYVSIALTNACELRCPYCYAPKVPGRLDADAVARWARELDEAGALGIGFGGGEPTAHPAFALLCQAVVETTALGVSFTTHGHRLDEDLLAGLQGAVHFARVSVDGAGATYERMRGRSFDALRRRLELVAALCPFGINTVVNADTIDELDAVADLAIESGAQELLLLPEQPVPGRDGADDETLTRLAEWADRGRRGLRLAISRARIPYGVPLADPFAGEDSLEAHAHLDARGVLRPDAYALEGVPVRASIMEALETLRGKEAT